MTHNRVSGNNRLDLVRSGCRIGAASADSRRDLCNETLLVSYFKSAAHL